MFQVKKEKCSTFGSAPRRKRNIGKKCRTETRMNCRQESRRECAEVVSTECRQVGQIQENPLSLIL